jgi:hypothetical protein
MQDIIFQSKLTPNSTQIPNHILDDLLPHLGDAELKVILIITRQTLGWIEDPETGRRKDRDWISVHQMAMKTGMGERSVNRAVASLVNAKLIETYAEDGTQLFTPMERKFAGSRIYYRLATKIPSLFDKPTSAKLAQGTRKEGGVRQIDRPPNWRSTKETSLTKGNTLQPSETVASEPKEEKVSRVPKAPSPHKEFIDFWWRNVKKARGMSPLITGMDGKNLQRVLKLGISPETLEKAAIYFLHAKAFRTFSPSISTLLSAGIINGIMNKMQNEPTFWKDLDAMIVSQGGLATDPKKIAEFTDQIAMLRSRLSAKMVMPYTPAPVD